LEQVFTRTAWYVIPIVWVPVASWFIYNSFRLGLPVPHLPLFVLLGIFVWTLAEYLLHRFLFHVQTTSYWGNTLHYLLHGCHHKHPMDSLRLVFPPVAATLIALPVYTLSFYIVIFFLYNCHIVPLVIWINNNFAFFYELMIQCIFFP
jgi:dihydroceramide fatty acyl 2-hydroxylase